MRKAYAILLAAYAVFLASSFAETAVNVIAAQNALPAPETGEKTMNTAMLTAKNGMPLEKSFVENTGNASIFIESINIDGTNVSFGSYLAPHSFAQYATVAGFAIVPNGSATINERETTYFPSSGKLKIALASNGAGGITVMIPGGAVPFLVVSQKNVKWSFGDGKLYIEATEPPMGAVTQVYFRTKRIAPLAGIVKDTEKLETIGYENSKALSAVMEAQEELEDVKAEESNARANVTERNLILIEAKKNVNALQRDITGKAGKIAALNERTKGMSSLDYWGFAFLTALSGAAIYVSARKGAK